MMTRVLTPRHSDFIGLGVGPKDLGKQVLGESAAAGLGPLLENHSFNQSLLYLWLQLPHG